MTLTREHILTAGFSLGRWALWLGLMELVGVVLGVAAQLPARPAFRPGIMLAIGVWPLLMLVQATLVIGYGRLSLGPIGKMFFFDTGPILPAVGVLFGISLSAGVARQPFPQANRRTRRPWARSLPVTGSRT